MISFTCGTYHGLFVDTGVPSVLPKDISYFDLRTRGGRAIPADETPNLIIRYNSSGEQGETPMIMVALCYRAIEGNREGFIAFGSLIFEPFSSSKIEEGIQAAIKVARNSTDIFNGKVISKRPTAKEGRSLDLTKLPLFEVGKFFGELNANISNVETIKNVSQYVRDIVSSGIDHFEIVVNPRRGMGHNDLLDHFNYLVSKQKQEIEDLRERNKRIQDRKRQEESLQAQRLIDKRNRNSFLLQVLAFGIAGTAILALAAFIAIKFVFTDERVDAVQVRNNDVTISDSSSTAEPEMDRDSNLIQPVENSETATCDLELLSDDDKLKNLIVSDLPTGGKCISVSESVTSLFTEQTLDQIVISKNSDFIVSNETPEINQRLLTTFGRIVDGDLGSKYVDDTNNFVLPDPSLSFAISMETVSPKLVCTGDVGEKNIFDEDFPKFEYYTHFQNDHRQSLEWFAGGVLLRIGQAFVQIGDEIYHDEPDDSEVTSVGNKLRNFGRTLGDFVKSEDLTLSIGDFEQRQNTCVILVTEEDEFVFYNDLQMPGERLISVSMDSFIQSHALVPEKYSDLVKERSKSTCQKIPGIFMVWKSDLGARMIMESTTGFTPYTYTNSEDFDFIMKPVKNYGSADYKLPAMNKFDDLREYFVSDTDFSPFSSELYTRENFCFSANPGGR